MSRIGKKPVEVPANVKVSVADGTVRVEGPLGTLQTTCRPEVAVTFDADSKALTCTIDEANEKNRQIRAYWGLTRALINNMVQGVTKGYQKSLDVVGVGYTAVVQGNQLKLTCGFAHPVMVPIPTGVNVSVERTIITVKGADKQQVGQFAANVRAVRKPEPYQGKGIRYTTEHVRRKEGKQFGA